MKFSYQARTKEGKLRVGKIEASSKEAAGFLLRKYDLYPTLLKEEKKTKSILSKFKKKEKVSKKDISTFSRQLSLMLSSQVSPVEALLVIASQLKKIDFREKILKISESVEGGNPLSEALSLFPEHFDNFYVSLIKSGESTGKISESLNHLSKHLENEYDINSRIKSALTYPFLVLFVLIIVLIIMIVWVVPTFAKIFAESGAQLPFVSRVIFGFFGFLKNWALVLTLAFLGIMGFFWNYFKTKEGKKTYDRISLKLPLFGDFSKKIYLSLFSENLSTLISAGLPITQSLRITKEVIGNSVYEKIIAEIEKEVSRGEKISSVLIRYPEVIPPFVSQMIRTGEETGSLDKTLLEIVNFYQKEIKVMTETFMSILEPVLILFVGIVVAILAVSIFSVYYGAMGTLY